jgi:hypothetical protein
MHPEYVSRFLRFEELSAKSEVKMAPKMRLIVIEFGDRSDDFLKNLRTAMEARFAHCHEVELLAEQKRDQVVTELYKCQEGRALYDPGTLKKVGNFRGATHGIFGSVAAHGDELKIECSLIDLETARTKVAAKVLAETKSDVDAIGQTLTDRLLAELAEVKILWPVDEAEVGRNIPVAGYGLFLPRSWTPWLSVLPRKTALHYFQLRMTVKDDGQWFASSVQIGDERTHPPVRFEVYALLADPKATTAIEEYHQQTSNDGLELKAVGGVCRVCDSLQVVLSESESQKDGIEARNTERRERFSGTNE